MEFIGLVRHEPNRGFFIEQITSQEVEEVYDLREMIELGLLSAVTNSLDDKGEKNLKMALDEYLEAARSGSLNLRLVVDRRAHDWRTGCG